MTEQAETRPLSGIKVIELSTFVAAPACGRLMSDLGAEVIKVESFSGDAWRNYGRNMNIPTTDEENPVFDIVNSGKKSVVLNLKKRGGMDIMLKLLAGADVFLTNTRAKSLRRLGLDYETLHVRFPKLVYATLTGFGDCGPEADSPGFDNVAFWGKSGFLVDASIETECSYPVLGPTGVGDTVTGSALFGGICAALLKRNRTNVGEYVTVSLYGSAIWHMGSMILRAQSRYGDKFPKKRLTSNPLVCPYKCNDGEWLMLSILEHDRYFAKLCKIVGLGELVEDPRFKDVETMLQNRSLLIKGLEEKFKSKSADEWKKILIDNNIVCEKLPHFADIENSEQAKANNFIEEFQFANGGSCAMPRPAIQYSDTVMPQTSRGPLLSENTAEVLANELGLSEKEIAELVSDGSVTVR